MSLIKYTRQELKNKLSEYLWYRIENTSMRSLMNICMRIRVFDWISMPVYENIRNPLGDELHEVTRI
jgi:hypothetical protein